MSHIDSPAPGATAPSALSSTQGPGAGIFSLLAILALIPVLAVMSVVAAAAEERGR